MTQFSPCLSVGDVGKVKRASSSFIFPMHISVFSLVNLKLTVPPVNMFNLLYTVSTDDTNECKPFDVLCRINYVAIYNLNILGSFIQMHPSKFDSHLHLI